MTPLLSSVGNKSEPLGGEAAPQCRLTDSNSSSSLSMANRASVVLESFSNYGPWKWQPHDDNGLYQALPMFTLPLA
jgi:hypothetical protein